jgi:crotonobetainyl-CoA:carnitine CoA-transferase CaiB-like acyl-CoA transferase
MYNKKPSGPLQGLRVVELAGVLAGPSVGLFFAELGADVLKVENKTTGGDVTRRWKLPEEKGEALFSAYYACVNQGKRTVLFDLRDPADFAQVEEAIASADIVISNFREDAARKLRLDYETLSRQFPRLIYGQITGFGPEDPRPAFDVVLQAEAGFLDLTGEPGGNPVKMPVALIDLLAAHQLKEGLLLALWQRDKTGKGTLVQVSLMDAALASLANQATNWLMGGVVPQRMGTQHPNIAPYGDLFACAEGAQVVLAIGTERQFTALCEVLGHPEWAEDERFRDNAARVRNRKALNHTLQTAIAERTRDTFTEACLARDVPLGAVRNMREVFESKHGRRLVVEWTLPDGSPAISVRSVVFEQRG